MSAVVLHVDMDAFFASVEVRSDPRLAGKPIAVGGGPSGRGVVTTASYAAREYGVRSGMSMAEALARCPHLLALPVDGPKVVHESLMVLRILDRLSPRVEAASIDEAYV
jgi:nucleotidyltransferase/DNA polymerase involved in DNA repair